MTDQFPLVDRQGSTVAIVDTASTIQEQFTYEPFGRTTRIGDSASDVPQFTGRERDGSSLYFYRARYYDPTTSRFVSQDPARSESGITPYAYVGNSPAAATDPSGMYTNRIKGPLGKTVDSAMKQIKKELEKATSCQCEPYFTERGVSLKTWLTPGGYPYIGYAEVNDSTTFTFAQERDPWVWLWVTQNVKLPVTTCDLGGLLLHEMGHLARNDTFDNEPADFGKACTFGCIGVYRRGR